VQKEKNRNLWAYTRGIITRNCKNIRKLTRVGRSSLSVTIPVEIVKQLKWKERQKVILSLAAQG